MGIRVKASLGLVMCVSPFRLNIPRLASKRYWRGAGQLRNGRDDSGFSINKLGHIGGIQGH